MSAAALLNRLRALGMEMIAEGDDLRLRGRGQPLTPDLRYQVRASKRELIALLTTGGGVRSLCCPGCGRIDYLPLDDAWRRCWVCGQRWGPATTADPGDLTYLPRLARALVPERRGALQPAAGTCPSCGGAASEPLGVSPTASGSQLIRCLDCGWRRTS